MERRAWGLGPNPRPLSPVQRLAGANFHFLGFANIFVVGVISSSRTQMLDLAQARVKTFYYFPFEDVTDVRPIKPCPMLAI
ncbi:hypothetical protein N658DRAFT_491270 [Parathielavia hyrcaniae]|uniref:Uncharacterized protein n=1 Tax=Parathielavia hyrcaniae TaxID=113614 RepID=A0AAN6QAK1_9PEZI|nr:hypothetical protein N658DRAFT_491270 [Parathielavia hyrcaniae]